MNSSGAGSIINPAESANLGLLAVGAAPWGDVNSIESYSSRGPTPDGRVKPDVVGADCGETAISNMAFCGTSQASPHVAGMVALVRQRFPQYTPAQVVSYLKENAQQRITSPDPQQHLGPRISRPSYNHRNDHCGSASSTNRVDRPSANGQTQIHLSWSAPSDDGGTTITGYRIEASTNSSAWSDLVANTRSSATSYSHTGLTAGSTRHYRVSAINSAGTGTASNVANDTTDVAPVSDLLVDSPTVSDGAPDAGLRFTLNATVRNEGTGPSAFTTLRYYQSSDPTITSSDTPVGTDSVSRLDASESGDEWISLTAPSTPGTYYYGACVDSVSDESDMTNNCSHAVAVSVGVAPAPDLVVETPTVDASAPAAGARFSLSAKVRNDGNGSSTFTTLRYYQSSDSSITSSDTSVGTDSVSSLEASGSGDESISLTAPSTPGTYYYGACVDALSDELDAQNNCSAAVTVAVGAAPAPDLVVDAPTVSDASAPAAGARFMLNANGAQPGQWSISVRVHHLAVLPFHRFDNHHRRHGSRQRTWCSVSTASGERRRVDQPDRAVGHLGRTTTARAWTRSIQGSPTPTNNCSSAAVTVRVGAAPAPDLVVDTLNRSVGSSPLRRRSPSPLNATVRRTRATAHRPLTTLALLPVHRFRHNQLPSNPVGIGT